MVKTTYSERDADAQVVRIHESLTVNGRTWENHPVLQALRSPEAVAELLAAGFAQVEVFGSHQLEPYVDSANTLLVVAEAD